MLNGQGDSFFDGCIAGDVLEAFEYKGVMRHDEVTAAVDGLAHDGGGDVDTQQHAAAVGPSRAYLEAGVIPALLERRRRKLFDCRYDLSGESAMNIFITYLK